MTPIYLMISGTRKRLQSVDSVCTKYVEVK